MEARSKKVRITLKGQGYKYQLFEVRPQDMGEFLDKDRGVYLRNKFRKYLDDDRRQVASGGKSKMIQFCTLVDDPGHPCQVTVDEGDDTKTYLIKDIKGWQFIVPTENGNKYKAHMPEDMPFDLMRRIEGIIDEYLDSADSTSVEALNGEYITFFNLYIPDGKMMLCMRSRDAVQSDFEITLADTETTDIDLLRVMCREAQEVTWHDGQHCIEYDANSLIYDSRWHSGEVHSERKQNIDYFVSGSQPTAIDARWFESWAV